MPAYLADRCRRSISQKRWRDGGDYVAKGRVAIDDSDAAGLMASVKGSDFSPTALASIGRWRTKMGCCSPDARARTSTRAIFANILPP